MREILQFALLGLGIGAIYALLAQGVVLIYRGSGILNLAQGAFAMFAAYVNYTLHVTEGIPSPESIPLGIAVAALLGAATDVLLMRRLRTASPLARLIGTLGVLIVLQSVAVLWWGNNPIFVTPVLPGTPHQVLGITLTTDRLWLLVIAVVLTGVLTVTWRYTRIGWVASAVAENQRGAAALGWSPGLVSACTWAAGGALAGLAGILVAPITQLSVPTLTLIVIGGLAAALAGGFRSFPLTLAGALVLGILQSETNNYLPLPGAADALPFLLIVVLFVARGSSLPLRGHVFDRLPRVGSGRINLRIVLPAAAATVALLSLIRSYEWSSALTATFAVGIVLLSIVVITGYAGQVSLAQYALSGLGALTAARLMTAQHWPFPLAALSGIIMATLIGLIFALPALRTRGVNLTVVTLGLGLATESVVFNNGNYAGGGSGISIESLSLFGWRIEPSDHLARYSVVVFVAFLLCALAVANLRRGRSGRRLLAVRANERAAAAAGINVMAAKLHAFAVSGAIAGVGGVAIGFSASTVTFTGYGPLASIAAVAYTVVGGVGLVLGALAGALLGPGALGSVIFNAFSGTATIQDYLPLVGGVGVIVTLLANPDGVVGAISRRLGSMLSRVLAASPPVTRLPATGAGPTRVRPQRLTIQNLTIRYGATQAVRGMDLTVAPGEVVGLIGPNGAGKTSLMDAVTGFTPYSGRVALNDVPVDQWAPHRRARAGLVRSFQGLELFEDLSVLENLRAASEPRDLRAMVTDLVLPRQLPLSAAGLAAVQEFGLADDLDAYPADLPYGRRRLVAVARAVCGAPSVLLLDEPVAGLDEAESAEIARLVRRLADSWGIAVLVIEHDLGFVMSVCDRIQVMDFGRPVAHGSAEEIQRDPAAIAAYLGEEPDHDPPGAAVPSGPTPAAAPGVPGVAVAIAGPESAAAPSAPPEGPLR